ncbi:MAG: WYL domain-containing protein [Gammaproteobacteria bacterium]|nr:WYL domain-containing protein [Gammaproteobacteria bacterium]
MKAFDRIYRLHQTLKARRHPVSMASLQQTLECSRATVCRHIQELRDYYQAPLENVPGQGYRYSDDSYELPGLWFNALELESLLVLQTLLANLDSGFLRSRLGPLHHYMQKLLENLDPDGQWRWDRLRILGMHRRRQPSALFPSIAQAVLMGRCLRINYRSRSDDRQSQRDVSPQRLTHYRDNWYLDAWCHTRQALRSFSLDGIREAVPSDAECINLSEADLDAHYASAYGIFAGAVTKCAVLRFSPYIARWISDEAWHPEQTARWLDDGRYELTLPYGNDTELILDICRYGPEVEVVVPDELRERVADRLRAAAEQYSSGG